jgi:Flp pilus assembly protein TadD
MLINPDYSRWNGNRGTDALLDVCIDSGIAAARDGDFELAVRHFDDAVHAQPKSSLAWYYYGNALLDAKQHQDAVEAFRKAVELSPDDTLYHYSLGSALYELGRYAEASAEFAPIVAADPQLRNVASSLALWSMTNLAICQEKLGQQNVAIETLTPASEVAVNILYNLGYLYFKAKRASEALPFFQAANIIQKEDAATVHMLGATFLGLWRLGEAVKYLNRAVKLSPDNAYGWYDLGLAFARLEKPALARRYYSRALRLNSKLNRCHYNLACLDALEGKVEGAFCCLEIAIKCGLRDAAHLQNDPDLKRLHRDPRWPRIVAQVCEADQDFKNQ